MILLNNIKMYIIVLKMYIDIQNTILDPFKGCIYKRFFNIMDKEKRVNKENYII